MNLITTSAAAELLGISQRRVQALISAGRLPATRIHARLELIDPRDLKKVGERKPGRPKKAG